jgi:hypothetical protein
MSILNVKVARKKCQKHFNEIGIYGGTDITRLIGYAEDAEDCYYILRYPSKMWKDRYSDVWCSMVGGWFSIKRMGKTAYNYTEMNCGIPKADEYTEKLWEAE